MCRLRRIVEHGLTEGLRQTWITGRPKCPESHSSTPVPVQVEEFSPAIFFLIVGSIFSTFVLALEFCYERLWPCRSQSFPRITPEILSDYNLENTVKTPEESIEC